MQETTRTKEELAELRLSVLERARTLKKQQRAEELEKLVRLVDGFNVPPGIESPPFDPEVSNVHWNKSEMDALFAGVSALKTKADFLDWENMSEQSRVVCATAMIRAIMVRFLPEHRHRAFQGLSRLPRADFARFYTLFNLTPSSRYGETGDPSEPAAPAPEPEPPKVVRWTDQEQMAFIIHLCHILRKEHNLRIIPQVNDHVGCIILGDAIRLAQSRALPRHRRLDLTFARRVLLDYGMMPRLEPLLKLPELPGLPPPPVELEDTVNAKRPPEPPRIGLPHENGHQRNGHQPAPAPVPAPEPTVDPLAVFPDADVFKAALARMLASAGRVEAVERAGREAVEYCELLTEENAKINDRATALQHRIEELEEKMKVLLTDAERVRIPRVAILGCRKDEFDEIVKQAGDHGLRLDFKHYEQQQNKIVPVHADYAIALPGLSHGQNDKARDSVPPGQFIFLSKFSVSRTIAQLKAWFQPELVSATE